MRHGRMNNCGAVPKAHSVFHGQFHQTSSLWWRVSRWDWEGGREAQRRASPISEECGTGDALGRALLEKHNVLSVASLQLARTSILAQRQRQRLLWPTHHGIPIHVKEEAGGEHGQWLAVVGRCFDTPPISICHSNVQFVPSIVIVQ